MSMGYMANYAEVIEEKSIEKFCKKALADFMAFFAEEKCGSFGQFAMNIDGGDESEVDQDALKSYRKLQDAFHKKTGLCLALGYHNSEDDGSCYDEVSESYWCVTGMYQLTPAGKKMEKYVKRQFFCTFG